MTVVSMISTAESTRRGIGRLGGWFTVAVSVIALTVVTVVHPPAGPPLYDGLGFPDEPYRWVDPPPGAPKTAAATSATADIPVGRGVVPGTTALSAEQGPQVGFQIPDGALKAPAGATRIHVEATAVHAPPPPSRGTLVSNVYELSATADVPGAVQLAPGTLIVVNLRADKATSDPVVAEEWHDDSWTQRETRQAGQDIYVSRLSGLTRFALVRLPPGDVPAPGSISGASGRTSPDQGIPMTALLVALAVIAAALAGALLVIRRRLDTRPTPRQRGPRRR